MNRHRIPAASIGDTDLVRIAKSNSEAANEIARLSDLMDRGEETKDELLRLCQLLFDVGSVAASEYLLRRNLDCYQGLSLYIRLFGTERQDEFETAIDAFKDQFDLELLPVAQNDFLVSTFRSASGPQRMDPLALLSRPCIIKFGYIEQYRIEVDITLDAPSRDVFDADEWLQLFYMAGVWEIADAIE